MGAVWVKDHYPLREPRGPLPNGGNSAAKPHITLLPCASRTQR